jgi:hypothetical protein
MDLHQWHPLTKDRGVLGLKYSFGVATANTMAARMDDGTWVVVSPASGAPESALDELARDGDVSALVAPNGYHHLGQKAWRTRFPAAKSYAPEGAIARLASKAAGIPFEPMAGLTAKAGSRFDFLVPEGMKAADLLVRVGGAEGNVWFGGDLISNTVAADMGFMPRMVFSLLGGGPGYRYNPVPAIVYLKDKARWKSDVRGRMTKEPPAVMFPAHGEPVVEDVVARTQAILA